MQVFAVSGSVDFFSPENMAGYAATAVLALLNLAITYFVLRFFLHKPLQKVLRKRQEIVDQELSSAEEKHAIAENLRQQYEDQMANASDEIAIMMADHQAKAERQASEKQKQLEDEMRAKRRSLETDLAYKAKQFELDQEKRVLELSVGLLKEVLAQENDPEKLGNFLKLAKSDATKVNHRGESISSEEEGHV